MADLDPLIRLRKFELDEKQRVIARLYQEQEAMQLRKRNLLDQLRHEMKVMEELGSVEALSSYTQYSYAVKIKVEAINAEIAKIQARIDIALEDIRSSFGDLKKIEITKAKRLEEIEKENRRKEDQFFSDVAIDQYRRNLMEDDD
jgi:flagellar FliJ protein